MRTRWFGVIGIWVLAAGAGLGQVVPPVCSLPGARTSARRGTAVHPVHPSQETIAATAAAGASDPTVLVAAEPMENFGVTRYRVEDYADCVGEGGCYWSDVDAQTRRAEAALDAEVKAAQPGEKLAMVLDIDETSLTNYCEEMREDFGHIASLFNAWLVSPQASMPIPGTLRLFDHAREAGVSVFFITGRPGEQREATARNLQAAGYKNWAGLRMRVGDEKRMSTVEYKSSERRKIVEAGYRLVLNVGDQWSDLNGDSRGEVSVKLPNPFYYLP
ncbi:MAG TPA: HAD family acid phosphatase [Granulicella sp.]|jgi:acid phosphatase|nr:HAD family acid phosphatase [Granulicella sp.]